MGQVILLRLIEILKDRTGCDHSILIISESKSLETHHMEMLF